MVSSITKTPILGFTHPCTFRRIASLSSGKYFRHVYMHKGLLFCGIAVPISNVAKGVLSRNQKDDMVNDLVFGLVYTLVLVLSPIMHDS